MRDSLFITFLESQSLFLNCKGFFSQKKGIFTGRVMFFSVSKLYRLDYCFCKKSIKNQKLIDFSIFIVEFYIFKFIINDYNKGVIRTGALPVSGV